MAGGQQEMNMRNLRDRLTAEDIARRGDEATEALHQKRLWMLFWFCIFLLVFVFLLHFMDLHPARILNHAVIR